MADELKPPVAIRITRPYATEAEFLEREFDTLTHTSVVLLGAQARPQGVVLRFEIVLNSGESLLRGEGRVVGYKERAYGGEPGLSLRFTRLDSRSKTLVDRASALRDARVRASTSLMSMPAVVVPKPAAAPSPPLSGPEAPPRMATPVPQRPSTPPPAIPPSPATSPPPAASQHPSRRAPPPLPEWAKAAASPLAPWASELDVESTQVDVLFDHTPQPIAERPVVAAPVVAAPLVAAPLVAPPLVAPAARQPIRPTPARPPPLPRTLPVKIPPLGAVAPLPPIAPAPTLAAREQADGGAPRSLDRPDGESAGSAARSTPDDRDALLTRLRTRAQSLPPARVADILTKRA